GPSPRPACGARTSALRSDLRDRPEPELRAGDVLARVVQRVLLDPRVLPGAAYEVDAVGAAQDQAAVLDRVVVTVERADGRPGRAVALGVVLAAVARAAEPCRLRGGLLQDLVAGLVGDGLRLAGLDRAVRLHRAAEMRASVREDREARLVLQQAVVPDVRRASRDLAGGRVLDEGRDHVGSGGEVGQQAEVDV